MLRSAEVAEPHEHDSLADWLIEDVWTRWSLFLALNPTQKFWLSQIQLLAFTDAFTAEAEGVDGRARASCCHVNVTPQLEKLR